MISIILSYLKYIGEAAGKNRNKSVLEILPYGKDIKYLDLGCGDGELTLQRARKMGTNLIFGSEIIPSEIIKAKQKKIIVKREDLNGILPYKNNEFDVVTATQIIEHLNNVDIFISEVHRILKPNGILIISTENLASWHNIFALILGLQPSTGPWISSKFSVGFHPLHKEHIKVYVNNPSHHHLEQNPHTRVMTYRTMKKLFESYNFKVIDERTMGYYPFPPFLSNTLARLDKWHAVGIVLKLKKE